MKSIECVRVCALREWKTRPKYLHNINYAEKKSQNSWLGKNQTPIKQRRTEQKCPHSNLCYTGQTVLSPLDTQVSMDKSSSVDRKNPHTTWMSFVLIWLMTGIGHGGWAGGDGCYLSVMAALFTHTTTNISSRYYTCVCASVILSAHTLVHIRKERGREHR